MVTGSSENKDPLLEAAESTSVGVFFDLPVAIGAHALGKAAEALDSEIQVPDDPERYEEPHGFMQDPDFRHNNEFVLCVWFLKTLILPALKIPSKVLHFAEASIVKASKSCSDCSHLAADK